MKNYHKVMLERGSVFAEDAKVATELVLEQATLFGNEWTKE